MSIGEATALERATLAAARRGDEHAFRRLVEPRRRELHAHCYRMLGSLQDAEDALQETLLRAWRALPRFEGRSSLRAWLYKIATNTCLTLLARRPARVLPIDYGPEGDPYEGPGQPLVESVWIDPYPDEPFGLTDERAAPDARYAQRESVELAFIAALQHLAPLQRAVLILREVLGYSAKEVAATLETTVPSVNSALQRARKTVEDKLPEQSQQAALRALGDARLEELVGTYMAAWEHGDVEGVVALLSEDAIVTMPPMPTWYAGREAITVFLSRFAFAKRWSGERFETGRRDVRLLRTRASGQVAFAGYNWDEQSGSFRPYVLQVLAFAAGRIREIDGFVTPQAFAAFGLPAALPA